MGKATSELAARVRGCDVVLEVRDARVPFSSANPLLDGLCASRPRLVVLNKADLAAEQLAPRVRAELARQGLACHFTTAVRGGNVAALVAALDAVVAGAAAGTARASFSTTGAVALVVGLPNTGKSTLINAVRAASRDGGELKKGARTGAQPGVTRSVSLLCVRAAPPLYLADSPGVMPPRVDSVEAGLKLLLTGAVQVGAGDILPSSQVQWLLGFWQARRALRFAEALGLARPPQDYTPEDAPLMLQELALRLHLRGPQGEPDLEAAARHVIKAFAAGKLGRYTLDDVPLGEGGGGAL